VSSHEQTFSAGLVLDGRYRLERPLGQGGMGMVWVGHQLALGREVAIKSIRPGRPQDDARLEREARLLATVRHPAIVQIFDFGRTPEGLGYVVMELVQGPSLEARCVSTGPLRCDEAVGLLVPLLDGLAAVHAAGIVHRDIKPANIVLAHEEPEGARRVVAKLLDFGIARNDEIALTLEGVLVGTPAYMAPEQFLGGNADARTDLWAVAATLYDIIAGEPPFAGSSVFQIMRSVTEDPPPFPRKAVGLDGKLWSVLMSALRKDPSERPESALILRDRLRDWLVQRSGHTHARLVPVAPPSAPDRTGETVAPEAPTEPPPSSRSSSEPLSPSFDALIKERLRDS